MKYFFWIILVLLALAAALRIGFDYSGQPTRLVFDTPEQALTTRRPHPAGVVPYGTETPATGTGAELFAIHCAHCHGTDGSGRSYTARTPGMPAVGNLITSERPAEEQSLILEEGRGAMPAFHQRLRTDNRRALLQHIQSLKP